MLHQIKMLHTRIQPTHFCIGTDHRKNMLYLVGLGHISTFGKKITWYAENCSSIIQYRREYRRPSRSSILSGWHPHRASPSVFYGWMLVQLESLVFVRDQADHKRKCVIRLRRRLHSSLIEMNSELRGRRQNAGKAFRDLSFPHSSY